VDSPISALPSSAEVARDVARAILDGFDKHYRLFRALSTSAKRRWEDNDWIGVQRARKERIGMYAQRVREAVIAVRERFQGTLREEALWPDIKRAYVGLLYDHMQPECAETFFNSVSTRILGREYFENKYLFWRPAISTEHLEGTEPAYSCHYPGDSDLREAFWDILNCFGVSTPFQDLGRDLDRIVAAVAEVYPKASDRQPNFQLHVLRSLFFRNKAAYVVGRAVDGESVFPFVIPLLKDDAGKAYVDTILLDKVSIGRILSVGQAYFKVDMEVPSAYVEFLRTIAPTKPKAELYTMVGLQKQGKTLFYRDLTLHLSHSTDKFVSAPGTRGMVMIVFTLPSYPYVFKLIRDHFAPPKDTDKASVEERYRFVKMHDRVGRMSDALEFSQVALPLDRFDKRVLDELRESAPSQIEVEGDRVVITHVYIERRLVPLDVLLEKADPDKMRATVIEYGRALRELAAANIFPGDLLLKNFGLTRYGRVVFYDYDELVELTECRFRTMPRPRDDDDEMRSEPWFSVDAKDIFPEQFPTFLFPPGPARQMFLEIYPELVDARWWTAEQERVRRGEMADVFPYAEELRFCHRASARRMNP
jgi:isocitrate dehydrogenase kinase/phosphatase